MKEERENGRRRYCRNDLERSEKSRREREVTGYSRKWSRWGVAGVSGHKRVESLQSYHVASTRVYNPIGTVSHMPSEPNYSWNLHHPSDAWGGGRGGALGSGRSNRIALGNNEQKDVTTNRRHDRQHVTQSQAVRCANVIKASLELVEKLMHGEVSFGK
ncbi:hypothetical protein J6590_010204 [Homalodisca vitripennis]|nr:hypothetical protein J6590_010204 [Homalodisca vitripennis]